MEGGWQQGKVIFLAAQARNSGAPPCREKNTGGVGWGWVVRWVGGVREREIEKETVGEAETDHQGSI